MLVNPWRRGKNCRGRTRLCASLMYKSDARPAMNGMLLLHRDRPRCAAFVLSINLTVVGTSRCDVPARETAGGTVAPLHAARTAQRAIPTRFRGFNARTFEAKSSPKGEGRDGKGNVPPHHACPHSRCTLFPRPAESTTVDVKFVPPASARLPRRLGCTLVISIRPR